MTERPRFLAIGAHPDDVEFLCAGTLALLVEAGFDAVIASMSPGNLGSAVLGESSVAQVRRQEATNAVRLLGGRYVCVEARDFQIFFGDELCRRTTALIRSVRPQVVFTHARVDYLADHEETARIVAQACFAAPVPHYRTEGFFAGGERPTDAIAHLYYCDPVELQDLFGRPVQPGLYVDISSSLDLKLQMLACHESQREWLGKHHGTDDYLATMQRWGMTRGAEVGVEYAEGFHQHKGHAYPTTCLLSSVLAERVLRADT